MWHTEEGLRCVHISLPAGKVDVGAMTGLSGRVTYLLSEGVLLRAMARAGTAGIDLEVGAIRKWDATTSGYLGAQVGLAGVLVKGRVTRGGQTFEVPVLLSSKVEDWRLLVGAYVVPPLLYLGISR